MTMQEPVGSTDSISFTDRLMNVFADPSEAFADINTSPNRAMLWLVPFLVFIVLSLLFTYLLFVNDTLKTQIFDLQTQGLSEAVKEGRMTQAQADEFRDRMEGTGLGIFMLFGSLPAIFFTAAYFFGGALFLWLSGKLLWKSTAPYMKYVELYGIASWVGVLGYLVTMLMIYGFGTLFATPSAALTVLSDYNPMETSYRFLSAVNLFSIWQASVVGVGVSKLNGKPTGASIGLTLGLWIIWVAIGVPLGLIR
ncbi:MAG TPA: hypothetical protein VNN76_12675 [Bacteroidota bacterium]|nr:hypothetical protein [Bacteroidota bacterium]